MFTVNEIMELAEGLNDFLEKDSFIYLDHGDLDSTEKEREDIDAVWEMAGLGQNHERGVKRD